MELSKDRKQKTGAFYTPKYWADLAVKYMKNALPLPLQKYTFYDPAGGEGALLEALPSNCEKYATTLEKEDVEIMKTKGIKAWQFDFFNDDIADLPHFLFQEAQRNRLVVFTNPPYMKISSKQQCFARERYNTNDAEYLYFYRLKYELAPQYICTFSKWLAVPSMVKHHHNTLQEMDFLGGFMCHTKEYWKLRGSFAIFFSIFHNTNGWYHNPLEYDIWEKGTLKEKKRIYTFYE